MNPPSPAPSFEERAKRVVTAGGWAAFGITLVTATSVNAIVQALVSLLGGAPELGVDEFATILNAFILTAPLAITVTIVFVGLTRVGFTDDQWPAALIFVGVAVVVGLIMGNLLYNWFFFVSITVNLEDLGSTVQRAPGVWYMKVFAFIGWFLVGYYELFGFGPFIGAFIAGGFAAYAAHQLAPPA